MAKYNYRISDINNDIEMLTKGMRFQLPIDNKARRLYENLIDGGFIGSETRIEDFCVILGRYLSHTELPFRQIRWMKDLQLFRMFLDEITPNFITFDRSILAMTLFSNKGNIMRYPNRIRERLETRSSYDSLQNILREYNKSL